MQKLKNAKSSSYILNNTCCFISIMNFSECSIRLRKQKKKLTEDMLKIFFRGANETHVRLLLFHDHF